MGILAKSCPISIVGDVNIYGHVASFEEGVIRRNTVDLWLYRKNPTLNGGDSHECQYRCLLMRQATIRPKGAS